MLTPRLHRSLLCPFQAFPKRRLVSAASTTSFTRYCLLLVRLLSCSTIATMVVHGFSVPNKGDGILINCCQNKFCCKNWNGKSLSIVQTLVDLLPPSHSNIQIEATGCLSQCDKGPNIEFKNVPQQESIIQHKIEDADTLAAELELSGVLSRVPRTLLAAVKVMEKAHQGR